ncbi:MAG: hypothetical protein GY765_42715 [bacterium]|nr:hypothetical protein [bacterium]
MKNQHKNKDHKKEAGLENGGNRRDFLKKGAAGIAGLSLLPSILKGEKQETKKETKKETTEKRPFIYRTLGKTGIKTPVLSNGSAYNPSQVKVALDAGINHIFTSPVYQNGNDEKMIGEALKGRPRDSYIITTSIYTPYLQDVKTKGFRKSATAEVLLKSFNESMARLGVDSVDVFYLAGIASKNAVNYEPFVKTLQQLQKEGKIRHIGITTHMNEPEVLRAAADSKVYDVAITAYNFRQPHKEEIKKAIDYAAAAGMGIIAMKTMSGGFWDKERKLPINAVAALKWALRHENVHSVISGFSNFDEMELGLSIMKNLPLTAKEKADLKLGDKTSMTGLYCSQCEKCLAQCRHDFHIPTVMRSYMYAYGYRKTALAGETLDSLKLKRIPCKDCAGCKVSCTMGFDVREKILDISRLQDVPGEFLV